MKRGCNANTRGFIWKEFQGIKRKVNGKGRMNSEEKGIKKGRTNQVKRGMKRETFMSEGRRVKSRKERLEEKEEVLGRPRLDSTPTQKSHFLVLTSKCQIDVAYSLILVLFLLRVSCCVYVSLLIYLPQTFPYV